MEQRRNAPCGCGSGRKFKRCCGSVNAAPRSQNEPLFAAIDPRFITEVLRGAPAEFHDRVLHCNTTVVHMARMFGGAGVLSQTGALSGNVADGRAVVAGCGITAFYLLGVRMTTLLRDFVSALNERRLLVAALVGRAVIETAAAATHLADKLAAADAETGSARDEKMLEALRRACFGSRFPWDDMVRGDDARFAEVLRSYEGGKPKTIAAEPESVNVLTMMASLERRYAIASQTPGLVQVVYAQMCDFAHPSVGTAVAFLRPGTVTGTTRVLSHGGDRALGYFWCTMGAFVAPACEVGVLALSEMLSRATGQPAHS